MLAAVDSPLIQTAVLDPTLPLELKGFVSSVLHNLFVMNTMWCLCARRWLPFEGSILRYSRLQLVP